MLKRNREGAKRGFPPWTDPASLSICSSNLKPRWGRAGQSLVYRFEGNLKIIFCNSHIESILRRKTKQNKTKKAIGFFSRSWPGKWMELEKIILSNPDPGRQMWHVLSPWRFLAPNRQMWGQILPITLETKQVKGEHGVGGWGRDISGYKWLGWGNREKGDSN